MVLDEKKVEKAVMDLKVSILRIVSEQGNASHLNREKESSGGQENTERKNEKAEE